MDGEEMKVGEKKRAGETGRVTIDIEARRSARTKESTKSRERSA